MARLAAKPVVYNDTPTLVESFKSATESENMQAVTMC